MGRALTSTSFSSLSVNVPKGSAASVSALLRERWDKLLGTKAPMRRKRELISYISFNN